MTQEKQQADLQAALDAYSQGVKDTKKAISDKIAEMALYFDKWECYSGKYSSSSARESVSPEELGVIVTDIEVIPNIVRAYLALQGGD